MTDTPVEPLTEEEQAQLLALQQQQAMVDWQAAEANRLAELDHVNTILSAMGGTEAVTDAISGLQSLLDSDGFPEEDRVRVRRILSILNLDARHYINRAAGLAIALPMPGADGL